MTDYDLFAKFYDAVMGDRSKTVERLRKFIRASVPKAKTLLELACGTGALLKHLQKDYEVYGLDLSKGMLSVAKKELPNVQFFKKDMTKFRLSQKFDVILCVFDSINHLLRFSDWEKVFTATAKHLNEGGVFIFDVNTESKLTHHSMERTWVRKFDDGYMLMKVEDLGKGIFNWNVKIFERQKGNQYKLWEEDIREVNFPIKKVMTSLRHSFSSIKVIDLDHKKPSEKSDRLYFVCKK